MSIRAYFLVGATASGKTEVAHILARRKSLPILSVDSMQIYRDLNIGTAKPTPEERTGIQYYGLDIASPDQDFSVADFHDYVATIAEEMSDGVIVCGGTGLYSKVLTEGIERGPQPDLDLREKWADLLENGGLDSLRKELQETAPSIYEKLKDKDNPRRLIRALEWAKSGLPMERGWTDEAPEIVGLDVCAAELRSRIDLRAERMFEAGLIEETRQVLKTYGSLSRTASQAIGYAEAISVIQGDLTEAEALTKVELRTKRLAKKQRTWFRNKANVDWVSSENESESEALADRIEEKWSRGDGVILQIGSS